MTDIIPDRPTGYDLIKAIKVAADIADVPLLRFARPLNPNPRFWLLCTDVPTVMSGRTVERVKALIEHRPIPCFFCGVTSNFGCRHLEAIERAEGLLASHFAKARVQP